MSKDQRCYTDVLEQVTENESHVMQGAVTDLGVAPSAVCLLILFIYGLSTSLWQLLGATPRVLSRLLDVKGLLS